MVFVSLLLTPILIHEYYFRPRDFATIRGIPIVHKGKRWLLAKEVKQYGQDTFHTAPKGAAIPFSYRGVYCLVLKQRLAQ